MTDPYRDEQLRSVWRLVVLVILASGTTFLLHEMSARQAEAPPRLPESADTNWAAGDSRYFQARSGGASATVLPEEVAGQIKRVAAARGIPADSVRQMVNALIVNGPGLDIRALNQALDSRWPNK